MKSKSTVLTLENISRLIEQKLDQKLDQKLVPVFGELGILKHQIAQVDHKVDTIGQEMKEGFNTVFDSLENLGRAISKNLEPRLKRLEDHVFAR